MMIAASNVMSAQTEHGFVPFAVEQKFSVTIGKRVYY